MLSSNPLEMDGASNFTIYLLLEKKLLEDGRKRNVDNISSGAAQNEMKFCRWSETTVQMILCNQRAPRNPLHPVCLSKLSPLQEHHPWRAVDSPSDSSQPDAEAACPLGLVSRLMKGDIAQRITSTWNRQTPSNQTKTASQSLGVHLKNITGTQIPPQSNSTELPGGRA